MGEHAVIRSETHKNLKIDTRFLPELGYSNSAVMLMPNEIVEAQKDFPVVFRKHPETGEFFLVALLGFQEGQNLFLGSNGEWLASHLPLSFARGPFLIGFDKNESGVEKPVLSVDMSDPRSNESNGEPIFDSEGNATKYLDRVNHALAAMDQGMRQLKPLVEKFTEYKLIEPLNVEVQFDSGEKINMSGAYTVSEERLGELDGSELKSLSDAGCLGLAFYISGSVLNIKRMIELKNMLDRS